MKFKGFWFSMLVYNFAFLLQGTAGFFLKHVETGKCIYDTKIVQSRYPPPTGGERTLHFLELSDNCLHPASQFKFLNNDALLKLNVPGCLQGVYKAGNSYYLDMLYIHTDTHNINDVACVNNNAVTQTSWGGLATRYDRAGYQFRYLRPRTSKELKDIQGVDPYLKMASCKFTPKKQFHFGSVTCARQKIMYASCRKGQYMVVKTAEYRGLNQGNVCGSSYYYNCSVDVTCRLKRLCDGKRECNVTVDDNLFSSKSCPGLDKYLYFEYQCNSTMTSFNEICIEDIQLSQSTLPSEGFVKLFTKDDGEFAVCKSSLENVKDNVCRFLGYPKADQIRGQTSGSSMSKAGEVNCRATVAPSFLCTVTPSSGCSEYSILKCHVCDDPLLQNTQKFPDSLFTVSTSTQNHSAAKARISSGSSWCAPVADGNHYLQLNFPSLYTVNAIAVFGDSSNSSFITEYHLLTNIDGVNWNSEKSKKIIQRNWNGYNDVAIEKFSRGIKAKSLRIVPAKSIGKPCLRIEVCGGDMLPDKPTNLTANKVASRYLKISWKDPEVTGVKLGTNILNPLTKVRLIVLRDTVVIFNKTWEATLIKPYKLENLIPYTMYLINVTAGNSEGFGGSITASFTTAEDVPEGPPLNVNIFAISSSSLSVTWKPPDIAKRNGKIVSYTACITQLENETCSMNYSIAEQRLDINNVKPGTKYYVRVLASTIVGSGIYSNSTWAFSNGLAPEQPTTHGNTLTYLLQNPTLEYRYFFVVVMEYGEEENLLPSNFKNTDLVTYSEAIASAQPTPYIAAVMSRGNFKSEFTLGDSGNTSLAGTRRRRSNGKIYYNGPLKPGTNYRIFQRVFLNDEADYYSTDWSPVVATAQKRKSTGGGNPGAIAGAVVAAILVIILIVFVILFIRRRRNGRKRSGSVKKSNVEKVRNHGPSVMNQVFVGSHNIGNINTPDNINSPMNSQDESVLVLNDEKVYENNAAITAKDRQPIPIAMFERHVRKLKHNNMKELKLEFEDLPNGQMSNWDVAKKPHNTSKNRYGNAVTYNHSRVILSGDEKADYINASFVDGKTDNYYIATQGPKPKTVNDFWRMIFEHKCPTIVMLTTLKEMGKVKCEKYWPDESKIYGTIQVTITKTKAFADYVLRSAVVSKDGEHHKVQQFHYISWPDYGVPRHPTQLLTFRKHFKSYHKTKAGFAVIHCSAGVGRTGVFIAIDKILDDLDDDYETNIDVFGFVKEMRSRRINMVQTADQYMFIYDAIMEHIQCGVNEIEAMQIKAEIVHLSKQLGNGRTGFEEIFERLQSVTTELPEEVCEAALLNDNKKKNRNPKIYPSESNRPHLSHLDQIENSDYINACFVDGYLGKNYFIATQTPLKETINDFWRMVCQYKSCTIVMLNQLNENNQQYPMFWPTQRARAQSFGKSTVLLDSVVTKDDITVRKFIVSPTMDIKNGRMVHMIHYVSWPDHDVPKDVHSMVEILSEVENSQRAADVKGPVIVVCSDGAGRSGTYIAISNLVDRVKIVQAMDAFQCIKLIRNRRPQFVETADQFKLCYRAVNCVLELFDDYSNFSKIDRPGW
ncbi:receptor-type tyrosine-protein phosphatase S-like isoform X7 [Xenia sp. Carnegie-2017]|uniref:receptor-type tyrosine-protein phosphatase S-like isoform X7 n=1 Tax=Xenia sp. Carnegie-2017 TaxID=2897299 RepID=UPI001F034C85|nr:receptor-type tyrosine-protein phosphatase S-like isoform X7 [Xenia sp. Carnegie-2017]